MTWIQVTDEKKQLILKPKTHSFYTTIISHYKPYELIENSPKGPSTNNFGQTCGILSVK